MIDAPWPVRLAERTHPGLLPLCWALLVIGYFAVVIGATAGETELFRHSDQAWGSALIYGLVPAYLLLCFTFQWRRSREVLASLDGVVPDLGALRQRVLRGSGLRAWLAAGAGLLFGVSQFWGTYTELLDVGRLLDVSVFVANALVWATVGWVLAMRLPVSVAFNRAGRSARVDVYRMHTVRPFARIATLDVLVVMGAVALMPLQVVSYEVVWGNFLPGLVVGLPAGLAGFLVPIWGVRRAAQAERDRRLAEIDAEIAAAERADTVRFELLLSHRDRLANLNTWPVDVRVLARAAFYFVLPPLAWVAAALVENLVERIIP